MAMTVSTRRIAWLLALAACSAPDAGNQSSPPPARTAAEPAVLAVAEDSGLVYSADSSRVAFVRNRKDRFIRVDAFDTPAPELWIARRDGSESRLLLEGRDAKDPSQVLAGFEHMVFSNDGTRIFFLSPAWSTSGALHVVNIEGARESYVAPANSLLLLRTGNYADCLVISQHRYFAGTGSYDHYWLVAENGDELALVGYDNDEHLKSQIAELLLPPPESSSPRSCSSAESRRTAAR